MPQTVFHEIEIILIIQAIIIAVLCVIVGALNKRVKRIERATVVEANYADISKVKILLALGQQEKARDLLITIILNSDEARSTEMSLENKILSIRSRFGKFLDETALHFDDATIARLFQ